MSRSFLILFIIIFFISGFSFLKSEQVRKPYVAGKFYPSDKDELKNMIKKYLKKAPQRKIEENIKAIIVPHAGYVFSATVASHAYKQLKNRKYDTVILIGPSHYEYIKDAVIYKRGYWKTPLGKIKVDEEIGEKIQNSASFSEFSRNDFRKEHSLEVQLPFLQTILEENFKIVPILVNNPSRDKCRKLAYSIIDAIKDKRALIVCSTDMSHFHNYKKANKMDKKTIEYIEKLDVDGLYMSLKYKSSELCGSAAVITTMFFAKHLGIQKIELLNYANSGDVTGDHSRVVGYGAFLMKGKKKVINEKISGQTKLNKKQKKKLLNIARKTLNGFFKKGQTPEFNIDDPLLNQNRGAFVTLHKNGRLRGCLGYILPQKKLYKAISELVISSATKDIRFPPVNKNELSKIDIEISVLTVPKKINDINKIKMGKHGVIVKKGYKQGVYLPQVATETGWNKKQFLSSLCSRKAGLPADAWEEKDTKIYIFEAQVFNEKNLSNN